MSSFDPAVSTASGRALAAGLRHAAALYAATLFVSALLLFAVQPMFAKMVLPILGGAPSVWSVAMVFFQAALLAGYAYAHLLARTLAPARAALVHLLFLGVAALSLPIGIAASFGAPPTSGIELWLVALFAASIGLPFVALSANAPLLQSWFALSGHRRAKNPYVLYAASNLGSFIALLSYPFLLEPLLSLRAQTQLWSAGFAALAVLIAGAGLVVARVTSIPSAQTNSLAAPAMHERLAWMALAAIPSGLVVAVTAHITTDVAAAPFLWVIPLALFLLTFVATFRERPWIGHATVVQLVPLVVTVLSINVLGADKLFWLASIGLNLLGFFLIALLCHGELYRSRPDPARLTSFYLYVSLGGVIGGIFAGLIAPNTFNNTWEYPLLIAAALFALPNAFKGGVRGFVREAGPGLAGAVLVAGAALLTDVRIPAGLLLPFQICLVVLVGLMVWLRHHPARLFGLVVLAFAATGLWQPGMNMSNPVRSFFGVHKLVETSEGIHRLLFHGTTVHGAERVREPDGTPVTGRPEPLTYYYFGGPISEAIEAARKARGRLQKVAAVGLGTGSLACHIRKGENWTFFEIDAEVVRIARDPRRFRFLSQCAPKLPVVIGDARLTLAVSPARYDLIALDAFSSDSIPVHLLTREAFASYLSRLAPRGVIVVHISNRHLELASVVAAVGRAEGLVAYQKLDESQRDFFRDYKAAAHVVALARSAADLRTLAAGKGWHRIGPAAVTAWSDDYSNILGAIWRKKFGH